MPLSLRQRLTRQAAVAVVALVVGFGAITWTATSLHFYAVSRADAIGLARGLAGDIAAAPPAAARNLAEYRTVRQPAIWITVGARHLQSANAVGPRPLPGLDRPFGANPRIVVQAAFQDVHVLVSWPLEPVADLLRDLLVVLLLTGLAAGLAGIVLARWATARMLVPVNRMLTSVSDMVEHAQVTRLPEWSDADDEFRRLAATFNRLLALVEREGARQRDLLAHAAHELRTPLQVLQGNLDLLADWGGQDPQVRADSVRQSRLVLERLRRLVDDLMRIERAASGRPAPQAVALEALVRAIAEDARVLAPQLTVRMGGGAALIAATPWDAERALWAVVDNALKYTPAGGRVEMCVQQNGPEGSVLIADTGPGIAPEDQPHIFDRFYRGQAARAGEGFGLGLALVRALLTRDGGRVEVTSAPGAGTRVQLFWPLAGSSTPPA